MRRLAHPVPIPATHTLWTLAAVDDLLKQVDASMSAELQDAILTQPRLYLLRDRLEPQKRGPPVKTPFQMRHYLLSVADHDDRIALTKLLVSDHPFALEQFRWSSSRNGVKRLKVDREDRHCRLCGGAVESSEHALLVCVGVPELVVARDSFAAQVRTRCPTFAQERTTDDAETVLVALISAPELASCLAAHTSKVFTIYDSYALDWPVEYTERIVEMDDGEA